MKTQKTKSRKARKKVQVKERRNAVARDLGGFGRTVWDLAGFLDSANGSAGRLAQRQPRASL